VLTATALYASIGSIHAFRSGRPLANWLGIASREHSSGSKRRMGRITQQGDRYLRTLLIHGARSALPAAQRRQRTGQPLSRLQQRAVETAAQRMAERPVRRREKAGNTDVPRREHLQRLAPVGEPSLWPGRVDAPRTRPRNARGETPNELSVRGTPSKCGCSRALHGLASQVT
jgi:hypothetical protein